jgi:hypothetical protein
MTYKVLMQNSFAAHQKFKEVWDLWKSGKLKDQKGVKPHKEPTSISIIGTRKLSQLNDNLASLNVNLSDEQMNRLNEVSKIAPIFPNRFFEQEFVGRFVYGGLRDKIDA